MYANNSKKTEFNHVEYTVYICTYIPPKSRALNLLRSGSSSTFITFSRSPRFPRVSGMISNISKIRSVMNSVFPFQKLEQTVSGNSRLERELLVLRQKLQASRASSKSLKGFHHASSTYDCTTDAFDSELRKVQSLVGDMQRQRQELSFAVNQLTLNTNPFAETTKASLVTPPASNCNYIAPTR